MDDVLSDRCFYLSIPLLLLSLKSNENIFKTLKIKLTVFLIMCSQEAHVFSPTWLLECPKAFPKHF